MAEEKQDGNILHNLAEHLSKSLPKPSESPADLIKEQAKKMAFNRAQNMKVVADSPTPSGSGDKLDLPKPKTEMYKVKVGGYSIPLVGIPTVDMTTILVTILSLESKYNKRINTWLQEANFKMQDLDGKDIFPRPVKKKKNAKSKKRKM